MVDKNSVLKFLQSKDLAVLATVTPDGKSESALMAFQIKDDFTILMNTEATTRKIQNIIENNHVSLVIGGQHNDPSVQIEATARIADNQQASETRDYMLSKNPDLINYFTATGKFIIITPLWLRYSDFSANPPIISETFLIENAPSTSANN